MSMLSPYLSHRIYASPYLCKSGEEWQRIGLDNGPQSSVVTVQALVSPDSKPSAKI